MTAMLSVSTIPGARAQHHGRRATGDDPDAQLESRTSRAALNQAAAKSTSLRPGEETEQSIHLPPTPPPHECGVTGKQARCSLGSEIELSHDHADGSLASRNSCFPRDIPEQPLPPRGSAKVRPSLLHAGITSSRLFSDLVPAQASPRCLH